MKLSQAGQQIKTQDTGEGLNRSSVPITVIAGFLGCGKTTLLNKLLKADHGLRIAVMVNDFGAINVDSSLVVQQTDTVISLSNGCICCNVQNDLVAALEGVLKGAGRFDHILVEASGVSDPARIAHVTRYPEFKDRMHLNMILSLVDVAQFTALDEETRHLAREQLDAADIAILNKCDLSEQGERDEFRKEWLFKTSRIIETTYSDLNWRLLLADITHENISSSLPSLNATDLFETDSFESNLPLNIKAFRALVANFPTSLLRAKGLIKSREFPDQPVLFQMVGRRAEYEKLDKWPEGEDAGTRLVFIGRKGQIDYKKLKDEIQLHSLPELI